MKMFLNVSVFVAVISVTIAFQKTFVRKAPLTIANYDFLIPKRNGDNEKKEVGRLIKNIMFPGIYRDYADTAPTKQTVQVFFSSLNFIGVFIGVRSFFNQRSCF